MRPRFSFLPALMAGASLLGPMTLPGTALAQGGTDSMQSRAETVTACRTTNTRRKRFVHRPFSFTGKVMHDTNLIRRSVVLKSDDGIRRRIDVPRGIRIYERSTTKKLSIHELHKGDHIRISGVQTDRKRWRSDQIRLLHKG